VAHPKSEQRSLDSGVIGVGVVSMTEVNVDPDRGHEAVSRPDRRLVKRPRTRGRLGQPDNGGGRRDNDP
jgi:hypothetical protein